MFSSFHIKWHLVVLHQVLHIMVYYDFYPIIIQLASVVRFYEISLSLLPSISSLRHEDQLKGLMLN